MNDMIERCVACGQPVDYCQGHGESGDPEGHMILQLHDQDRHEHCHPAACERADQTGIVDIQIFAEGGVSKSRPVFRMKVDDVLVLEIYTPREVDALAETIRDSAQVLAVAQVAHLTGITFEEAQQMSMRQLAAHLLAKSPTLKLADRGSR